MGLLDTIQTQTGLPKQSILKYALIFLVLFVVFGIGQAIITNLVAVAYPVFMSFHALESKEDGNDDKQWLTYWVIFGLFSVIDQFAGFILHLIPFYYVLKLTTLIVLFHPTFHGATYVYNEYIQPYVKNIDEIERSVLDAASSGIN
jgi:receptor expression-enhancing protein 5/6